MRGTFARGSALLSTTLLLVIVATSSPAPAAAHVETASEGAVTATLSWQGGFAQTRDLRLAIDRNGARAHDAPVGTRQCPDGQLRLACIWAAGREPLAVRDLDLDGEPEVVVAVFTGGAHCCVIALVYRWDGDAYTVAEHNFFDAGYRIADLDDDGRAEFRSADARFAYLYGSFAESVFPLQVIAYDRGLFSDATASFSEDVARDLRRLKREFRRRLESRHSLGFRAALAAYIADLYRLDRDRAAKRKLRSLKRRGVLARQSRFDAGPYGKRFIRDLTRHLRRWGYIG